MQNLILRLQEHFNPRTGSGATMTTLYVIGNGFDLHHELPTSYRDFYEHAKELLDELYEYYPDETADSFPWHDFENQLGKFKWKSFYKSHNHIDVASESFRPRDALCLEDEITQQSEDLVESIKEIFNEWIGQIDISSVQHKIDFDQDAIFLSFNYTSTLQLIYSIDDKNIFHIHGNSENYSEIIFGHAETWKEEPEIDENGYSNRTMFTDSESAAKYPFYAFKKPVHTIISDNQTYFGELHKITRIVVLGHSLNEIDLPYFQEIANNTEGCNWLIYCHNKSEVEHHKKQLQRCKVASNNIETKEWE